MTKVMLNEKEIPVGYLFPGILAGLAVVFFLRGS
jgi:hypothetical protein